ncbi:TPA: hypothetical protein ACHY47_005751, partial [Escherichia coli]|uniref:hypothetical protein n=1 Tax=Escherichia coli TaxID=562 RepID=UPI002AC36261
LTSRHQEADCQSGQDKAFFHRVFTSAVINQRSMCRRRRGWLNEQLITRWRKKTPADMQALC